MIKLTTKNNSAAFRRWLTAAVCSAVLLVSMPLMAAGGAGLQHAGNDIGDFASLQRGARSYMNYCSGCHSLKYLRYSRMAEDLMLTEEQVQENLNFTGAGVGEQIHAAIPRAQAAQWFGQAPPDLSLIARVRGSDWIYSYLKSFYVDESRPMGWNNTVFPNASMPNPLWELQGIQHALYGEAEQPGADRPVLGLSLGQPGKVAPEAFDQTVRDITNFLEYAGEPIALKRQQLGVWVLLFLVLLTFLLWLVKNEYWKDVH